SPCDPPPLHSFPTRRSSDLFRTQKAAQRSILVQIVEGESASPDDCSQIGKCVVRDLPPTLPAQTPIEVRFHYQDNGRLTVNVVRSEEHTSELQSPYDLVCRL